MAAPNIEAETWLALKSRVDTLATTPALPVAWPEANFAPPAGDGSQQPYLAVSDIRAGNERLTVGPQAHLRRGILQLMVMWPVAKPRDHAALMQLAGAIAAHFPADLCLSFGSTRLRVERAPDVAEPFVDGAWRSVPVRIRWRNA